MLLERLGTVGQLLVSCLKQGMQERVWSTCFLLGVCGEWWDLSFRYFFWYFWSHFRHKSRSLKICYCTVSIIYTPRSTAKSGVVFGCWVGGGGGEFCESSILICFLFSNKKWEEKAHTSLTHITDTLTHWHTDTHRATSTAATRWKSKPCPCRSRSWK